MPEDLLPPEGRPDAPAERHVFVYGTLRRGDANDITRLRPAPRFVGAASIAGTLYHLGGYPGLVLGGPQAVVGEVYAITPEVERRVDEIEEVYPQQRDEYFKRIVAVTVAGRALDCVVYEINPRYLGGAPVIVTGDWRSMS